MLRMNNLPLPQMPSPEEVAKKLSTRKMGKRKYKRQVQILAGKYARKHMRKLFKQRIIPDGSIDVVID